MQVFAVLLVLYLAHGHHVLAVFIGGRASCGVSRTVTAASFVSSNCYRLTNAFASLACSRYSNKPIVVNYGTSLFTAACQDPAVINPGPKFAMFSPAYYYADLQVVSSDTSANLLGTTSYLNYDPATGFLVEGSSPPYDVTQVYSFVLINIKTGATSDPVYFGAKLGGCNTVLAGPSSITVCIGNGLAVPAPPPPGTPVALFSVCSPGVISATYDTTSGNNCPIVTASSNGDFTPCYISKLLGSDGTLAVNYVLGVFTLPLVKFTQTLTITALPAPAVLPATQNFNLGSRSISVTFDPSCTAPAVITNC